MQVRVVPGIFFNRDRAGLINHAADVLPSLKGFLGVVEKFVAGRVPGYEPFDPLPFSASDAAPSPLPAPASGPSPSSSHASSRASPRRQSIDSRARSEDKQRALALSSAKSNEHKAFLQLSAHRLLKHGIPWPLPAGLKPKEFSAEDAKGPLVLRDVVVDIYCRFLHEDRLASTAAAGVADIGVGLGLSMSEGGGAGHKGTEKDREDADMDAGDDKEGGNGKGRRQRQGKSKGKKRGREKEDQSASQGKDEKGTGKRTKTESDSAKPSAKPSALLVAAEAGDCKDIELSLASGAAVDERDNSGRSALMVAAAEGHADAVELLINSKADVSATDTAGRTALALAATFGHAGIVSVLTAAEARAQAPGVRHVLCALHHSSSSMQAMDVTDDGDAPTSSLRGASRCAVLFACCVPQVQS